jgi:hypothetical protein
MADGGLAQTIRVKRRRRHKASLHDHSLAIAHSAVAGGAVDVEAILPALQDLARDWERELGHGLVVPGARLPRIEALVRAELAARHRAFHERAGGPVILKEPTGRERVVARLYVHVLAASAEHKDRGD